MEDSLKSMNICPIIRVTVSEGWICQIIQFIARKEILDLEAKNFILKMTIKNNFSVLSRKHARECIIAAHKHLDNAAAHLQGYDFPSYYNLNKVTKVAQVFFICINSTESITDKMTQLWL